MNTIETIKAAVEAVEKFEEYLQDNTSQLEWYEAVNRVWNAPVSNNVENICRVQNLLVFLRGCMAKLEYAPCGKEDEMFTELYKESIKQRQGNNVIWLVRSTCSVSLRKNEYDRDIVKNVNDSLKALISHIIK